MSQEEINKIKKELDKIYREFGDFQSTITEVLAKHSEESSSSTVTRGVITSAGANAEIILKYIVEREKIEVIKNRGKQLPDQNPNKLPALNDYIFTLDSKGILPLEIKNHLNTIQNWRNLSSHGNYLDKIDEDTIEAINGAVKSFTKWFFEGYLKGEYAEYSFGKKQTIQDPKLSQEKVESNNYNVEITPSFKKPKHVQKKKSKWSLAIIIILLISFSCLVYSNYTLGSEKTANGLSKSGITEKEEAFKFIKSYFNSLNENGNTASKFFARNVSTFYTKKNVNPTDIDIIRQFNDRIDNKHIIDEESLDLFNTEEGVTYWRFWGDFSCYRKSKQKYQTSKILFEFGINTDKKITSLKEIQIDDTKYWNSKPN